MSAENWLKRFGLRVAGEQLEDIREALKFETAKERRSQGGGDTEFMKLCCTQLFAAGRLEDALVIWNAKTASMDADASIDVQFLCGAGLDATKAFLISQGSPAAKDALSRIENSERVGDFENFTPRGHFESYADYFGVELRD